MLLKTETEIKSFVGGIQKKWASETMLPYIDQAEIKYIIPAIGEPMYWVLVTFYNDGSPASTPLPMVNLLKKVQRALAYYALFDALPFLNVSIGDFGVHESSSEKSSPAATWKYYNVLESCAVAGDRFLDEALAYMESQVPGTFSAWESSPQYLISKEYLINTTAELNQVLPIQNSRRAFLTIRPYLPDAELIYLQPALSVTFFDELKAHLLAKTLTVEEKKLVLLLQKALGNLALYRAMPKIPVNINGNGISVPSYQDYYKLNKKADGSDLTALKTSSHEDGEQFLKMALDYLARTASSTIFVTWYNLQNPVGDLVSEDDGYRIVNGTSAEISTGNGTFFC